MHRFVCTIAVLAAALIASATASATGIDQSVIPFVPGNPLTNGCPSGWEALTLTDLHNFGYMPDAIDVNGDGIICGLPWTTAEQTARLPGALRPVVFSFEDNNLLP